MLKTIKHKLIKLLMFIGLALYLCVAGLLIVWLIKHGSSAAFELGVCLIFIQPVIVWRITYEINRYKQGGEA